MATAAVSELHTHQKYERLIAAAQTLEALPTAVAHPCDATSLSGAVEAADAGLIEPILVGPRDKLEATAKARGFNISRFELVDMPHSRAAAEKAALESATRYMAAELGPKGIRVHAISPGPLKTRAASGIAEFDKLLQKAQSKAPTRSLVSIDNVGIAVAFLGMDGAKLITGETLYFDGGYHIID